MAQRTHLSPPPKTGNTNLSSAIHTKKAVFRKAILKYARGGDRRRFPWREPGRSPYEVLIAEVLLKRTTSTAAAKVYEDFLRRFPNPLELSRASVEEIAACLSRVGLQWQRANAARKLAVRLVEAEGGTVPHELSRLLLVPGVGEYTARAMLSIGFGIPAAVVDSNVERILQRVFMDSILARFPLPLMQSLAGSLLPAARHREFNFGILDLGALICRPAFPRCEECPLAKICDYNLRRGEGVPRVGTRRTQMGSELHRIRKQKGVSLVQLARNAKLSKLTVIRIESGKSTPLPQTVRKLAGALGVPVDALR